MTGHLVTEPARMAPCGTCGHAILAAMVDGRDIRADMHPLSVAEEVATLLAGKPTYDICVYGLPRRMYLHHRDIFRIRAQRVHTVVTLHACPVLFSPSPVPETELVFPYATELPDDPPF